MSKIRQDVQYHAPIVERSSRPGVILRIVLLAIVLTASAGAFIVFKNQLDNEFVLGLLGVLAMVGIFFFVSAMIGFIEIMPASRPDELSRTFVDSQPEGTLITDRKGRIVYANAAYGALTGATRENEAQTLETLFSRDREATEPLIELCRAHWNRHHWLDVHRPHGMWHVIVPVNCVQPPRGPWGPGVIAACPCGARLAILREHIPREFETLPHDHVDMEADWVPPWPRALSRRCNDGSRDGAPNPEFAGPLGANTIRRLTDPDTGIVLDSWLDSNATPHGPAAGTLPSNN